MKFVILDRLPETPIVFPEFLTHADVAEKLGGKVLSAGFCKVDGKFSVHGGSIGYGIKASQSDADVLNKMASFTV